MIKIFLVKNIRLLKTVRKYELEKGFFLLCVLFSELTLIQKMKTLNFCSHLSL